MKENCKVKEKREAKRKKIDLGRKTFFFILADRVRRELIVIDFEKS
jgi:hypothetical protein